MSPSTPIDRLHSLDALRGFALLLGIAVHASLAYLPESQFVWLVSDGDSSQVLAGFFHWAHSFRMLLFFLIAGLFGRMALERLGLAAFLRDRGRRIAMPLMVFWPPVFMAIVAVIVWNAWLVHGGQLPEQAPPGPAFTPDDFPLTHLWFLYVLLLLYVGMLALRGVFIMLDRTGQVQATVDALFRRLMWPWAPVLLALPVALALSGVPSWIMWFGIPTPDSSLYPNLAALTAYGLAFPVGWALHRQMDLLHRLSVRWPLNLMFAVTGSVAAIALAGLSPGLTPAPEGPVRWAYAFAYALAAWGWTFALIGLGLRLLSGASVWRRYLADASYWIYLVHLPLVMAAQVLASRVDAPWWIEFPLIVVTVLAVALLSYHAFVRHGAIGAMLNGRRHPRPVRHPRVPAAARQPGHFMRGRG